jgi:hypothetical protein
MLLVAALFEGRNADREAFAPDQIDLSGSPKTHQQVPEAIRIGTAHRIEGLKSMAAARAFQL